jgi:predicted MPP superfamily phosphohydrolase
MRWIFFLIVFLLLQFYSFQAIRTITKSTWIYWVYWIAGIAVIANVYIQFSVGPDRSSLNPARSYAIGFMMIFVLFYLLLMVTMFGEDIFLLCTGAVKRMFSSNSDKYIPSRRKFVSQIALGLAAIPFSAMLYGIFKGKYNFKVLKYSLTFPDLPEAFDGYTITQISDIHAGSFDNHEKIEYAIDLVNKQKNDVILFTGDLVNNKASEMYSWKDAFSKLSAKDGVFSVLGNHDYGDYVPWSSEEEKTANLDELKQIQKEMGFKLLLNEHTFLTRGEEKIALVGVENWGKGGFKKAGDLQKSVAGLSKEEFKIIMSHDPSHWEEQIIPDEKKFHLTLSGHTHGMQFGIEIPGWFKWSPIQWRYKQWAGIYSQNDQFINVNRGFGYLAYPGRVGIWPEITTIELKRG